MSKAVALQFISRVNSDAALRSKLKSEAVTSAGLQGLLQVAAESGFNFSAADFQAAAGEAFADATVSGELTDTDLERVAGGAIYMNTANQAAFDTFYPSQSLTPGAAQGGSVFIIIFDKPAAGQVKY